MVQRNVKLIDRVKSLATNIAKFGLVLKVTLAFVAPRALPLPRSNTHSEQLLMGLVIMFFAFVSILF